MTKSPPEREAKVRVVADKDPVPTSFEKWAQPGHFDRTSPEVQKPQRGFGTYTPTPMISIPIPVT